MQTSDAILGCAECGIVQSLPALPSGAQARCRLCAMLLERNWATDIGAAQACALATLLLLIPANLSLSFRADLLGVSREGLIANGAVELWHEGWPVLAIPVLLFAVIVPFLRFGLLGAALAALRAGRHPRALGAIFRWAERLAIWAMPEVLVMGMLVSYGRLQTLFSLKVGPGVYFLVAASIAALTTRAFLDRRAVWEAILPSAPLAPARDTPSLSCPACDLVLPLDRMGASCPRCGDTLAPRKTDSIVRTAALVGAAVLFYIPANLLPMAATIQLGAFKPYTILQSVRELIRAQLWGLALLVFVASFAIPLLKLAVLVWCLWSTQRKNRPPPKHQTRAFRIVREIGRWSMIDIFAIATFLPLMRFGQLASAQALAGSACFVMVVILTMLATEAFDPRLMWDAAR